MKKFTIILTVLISVFTLQTSFARTAADYYLPLCVDNYLKLQGTDRTTFYSIVRSDSINGYLYFVQKGMEIMDNNPTDTSVFHYFWFRKDSVGNILVGAYNEGGSVNGILDSAVIVDPPFPFFPNQYLAAGYSRTVPYQSFTYTDSVISVTATAGAYTNCIQIRNTRKVNGIIDMVEDSYYAYHIGMIKYERLFPANDTRVGNIVNFIAIDCYSAGISDGFVNENEFSIYPNPAFDIVTMNIDNPSNDDIELNIYTVMGVLVRSEKLKQNQHQINIRDLSNGIYMVVIKSKYMTENRRLIIQR
jgi:hypothetical protein